MLMLPVTAMYLVKLYKRLKGMHIRVMLACVFIVCSVLSGGLSIAREIVSDYQLLSADEVLAAEYIEENLPADAVILTGDQHNNAVAALTGRDIVCGTGSYLYFHGLDYSDQYYAMKAMLTDPENNRALFEEYGVDYVYISDQERYGQGADDAWFAENCDLLFASGNVCVYAYTAV